MNEGHQKSVRIYSAEEAENFNGVPRGAKLQLSRAIDRFWAKRGEQRPPAPVAPAFNCRTTHWVKEVSDMSEAMKEDQD